MLTVSLALLALACQPGRKRRLVIGVPAGPASINTNAMNEEFTLSVLSNIYETVVDLDGGDGRLSYEYLLHTLGEAYGLDNGGGYSNPEVDALIEKASA